MRKSGGLLIPLTLILAYYTFWTAVVLFLTSRFPGLSHYLPVGGVDVLAETRSDAFEPVYSSVERSILSPSGPIRLLLACVGAIILTVPVSWTYFITSRVKAVGPTTADRFACEECARTQTARFNVDTLPV